MTYTSGKNISMGAIILMILRIAGGAFFLFFGRIFGIGFLYDIAMLFYKPIFVYIIDLILASGFALMFLERKNPIDLMGCISLLIALIFDIFYSKIINIAGGLFITICLEILVNSWVGILALRAFSQGNRRFFTLTALSAVYIYFGDAILNEIVYRLPIFRNFAALALAGICCICYAIPLFYLYTEDKDQ